MGDMPSESPVRQLAGARTPIHDRVSAQVRRFALLWAAAALGVVAAIILARIASGAYEDQARQRATAVDRAGLVARRVGLAVLRAGGARLLQKAWRLAVDADARRERQVRWSDQIEQILAWSSRAKEATTRSQLIGFAHMAPRDAIGAACLTVAEGGPPAHRSHGLARLSIPVDAAGEGLHASVCFAPGRGDDLDHHALDLMLGHLAALWRTVLRQEELERAAGHDALTGLPNRRPRAGSGARRRRPAGPCRGRACSRPPGRAPAAGTGLRSRRRRPPSARRGRGAPPG